MASKKQAPVRSIEEILTDIHNTLTEGLEAILAEAKEIKELLHYEKEAIEQEMRGEPLTVVPAGAPIHADGTPAEKELPIVTLGRENVRAVTGKTEIDHDDVPKDVSEWIAAHPGCKAADVVKTHSGISLNRATAAVKKYGKPAPEAKKEAKPKITIEALREKISTFSEKFGMNEALAVNEKFGGSRKVSNIPEVAYEKVFIEMDRRLHEQANADEHHAAGGLVEVSAKEAAEILNEADRPTLDDVRAAAKEFLAKYGEPALKELVGKFTKGAEAKLSKVPVEQYPALIEALSNA